MKNLFIFLSPINGRRILLCNINSLEIFNVLPIIQIMGKIKIFILICVINNSYTLLWIIKWSLISSNDKCIINQLNIITYVKILYNERNDGKKIKK